jgi:hypothetical protein
MAFRRSDLQEAGFVPGSQAFRVYGYGTTDPLEEVLRQGYFAAARALLRPGELIYVSTAPQPTAPGGPAGTETRFALVMVRGAERSPEQADGSARLAPRANHQGRPGAARVQDFGRPSDPACAPGSSAFPAPDAAPPPAKRGRGRPPGSRTKKAGVMSM